MANTEYIKNNSLREEANASRDLQRKIALYLGIPLAVVVGATTNLVFAAGILASVAFFWLFASGDAKVLAGAQGEEVALELLDKLPAEYVLFNQVNIPNKKSRTGYNEADMIVMGPNGVFVVEVKNNNSVVVGSENDREWEVHKVGRGGTRYKSEMRNPIAQAKKLVWLLSEELKNRKARAWIQGVVVFTHEDADVQINGDVSLPVLKGDELVPYIESFKGELRPQAARGVLQILRNLTDASGLK